MTPQRIGLSQLKYHWRIYFFALPSFILIALFQYYPALSGAFHSFYRWNGADINEFVGLENYAKLLKNEQFWQSFRVALIIGVWNIAKMIPAIAVAVCIHRCRSPRLQFLYRLLFVAPMVIPTLVVLLIWRGLFFEATSGYLNDLLFRTGLFNVLTWIDSTFHLGGIFVPGKLPTWLGDTKLILIACIIWGFPWVGSFAVLTHLAKLQGIPRELYEAAELDGTGWFRKFTKLELPLMLGSVNIMLVFVIIDTIKDAGMIMALAGIGGGPGGVVTVPALFMLREAFISQQMGAACTVGIVLTIVVLGLQKLMSAITEWPELPTWKRITARVAGVAVAITIYFLLNSYALAAVALVLTFPYARFAAVILAVAIFYFGFSFPFGPPPNALAAIILLAAVPWGKLVRLLKSRNLSPFPASTTEGLGSPTGLPRADAWATTAVQQALSEKLHARHDDPGFRRRELWRSIFLRFLKHAFIWAILAFAYLPLYLMLIVSLKNNSQFYEAPAIPTGPFHWDNWAHAWHIVVPALANSIFVTTASTFITLVVALGAAYFFARVKVPGSTFLWNAVLILMMMPTIANLIPLVRLLIDLNLANTLTALITVGAAGGQVFAIFMLRNFVADLPQALFEAAEIDGAGHLRQMFTIVAPLSGPILGVVGVMHAIGQWNDFILPLVIIRDQARLPVMVELFRMAGEYIKYWGPMMAGYALASIPIIILFALCMRLFSRGLTEGAEKG
jgi:ABC-type glycerol-3-phosphate transport system permease component